MTLNCAILKVTRETIVCDLTGNCAFSLRRWQVRFMCNTLILLCKKLLRCSQSWLVFCGLGVFGKAEASRGSFLPGVAHLLKLARC